MVLYESFIIHILVIIIFIIIIMIVIITLLFTWLSGKCIICNFAKWAWLHGAIIMGHVRPLFLLWSWWCCMWLLTVLQHSVGGCHCYRLTCCQMTKFVVTHASRNSRGRWQGCWCRLPCYQLSA